MRKNLFFVLCVVWIAESGISAQSKYAGEFLNLGAGARASALGGAMIATVNDVTAGYYNPAGLMQLRYGQIAYNHTRLFISDINYDFGAFAMPWKDHQSLGFSVVRLGVDNIPHTEAYRILPNGDIEIIDPDQYDPSQHRTRVRNYFNYASYAFIFSYARRYDDNLTLGANAKLIHHGHRYASANGIGFDVGAQYRYTDRLLLGAALQDLTGTLVAWNTGKREWIRPSLRLGAAYGFPIGDDHCLIPMLDAEHRFENRRSAAQWHWGSWSMDFHTGLEYQYKKSLFLRMGYNELNAWTFGTGIKLGLFQMDYAYTYLNGNNVLGNIHRIHVQFDLKTPWMMRPQ